jgi:hypothetical protein
MPPRFVYWTIIAGGLPTAFRATEREELLPTFKRIREKHPDAEMKYFARGRLWASADEAKQEADAVRARAPRGDARGRDWRPGGEHRDPRQKFKDAKKKRNLDWRKERFERRQAPGIESPREKPHGDPLRRPAGRPPGHERTPGGPPRDRKPGGGRPWDAGGPPRDSKHAGGRPWRPSGPPRDRTPGGPPRDRKAGGGRPWNADSPPPRDRKPAGDRPWTPKGPSRDRQFGGPPRERKFDGPPRERKPGGPPRDHKPGGPRRDFKPGGPPRDRRRRG